MTRLSCIKTCTLIWLLGAVLLTPQAGAAPGNPDYYEDALRRFDARDVNGAIVQLKNALQQNPGLLPAQVLLAEAYLITGMPSAAEAALEAAEKLGADRAVIAPKLGQALLGQLKYQAVLDRVSAQGLQPLVAAEVLTLRSSAYMAQGDFKRAEQTLNEAAKLTPRSVAVRVAQGTLKLRQGDARAADARAREAIAMQPDDAGAWNLQASVAHVTGDLRAALEHYAKALGFAPEHLDARLGRAGLLMDVKRHEEAEADLRILRKIAPGDPRASYLFALSAARKGDAEATRIALTEATTVLDQLPAEVIKGNPQLLMLGGLAHFGLGQPAKARGYLQSYVALEPRQPGARKLLATILLEERDYKRVVELLYPFAGVATPDPQVLTLLASAYMGRKQFQLATDLFEQASRLAPDLADSAIGVGLSHLVSGRVGQGMAQLQAVFDKDPGQTRAGILLVDAYLKRGETSKAVGIARRMVDKAPENLSALNLLGTALMAAKDAAGARAAFTRAARIQRNYLPAQVNLARLDLAEDKTDAARKRLDAILKASPNHADALLERARMEQRAGSSGEAIRMLERARNTRSRALAPMLYLVELYLEGGDAKNALAVALEQEAAHPGNLSALEAVGLSYAAGGRIDQARAAFNRMSRVAGFESAPLTRVAQLLMRIGAFDDANVALDKALNEDPRNPLAQRLKVELDLRAGRLSAAEKRARELRATHADAASARMLGTVFMAQNKPAAAAAEFKQALSRERSGANTLALFQAHLAAGEGQAAIALMRAWLRDNPRDTAAEAALAEAYLRLGQWAEARDAYLGYLKKRPKDVGALNNLANILLKLDDPRALDHARQAHALAPGDANVADTLGWILVRQGQAQQALPYLRDARLRAPANPLIQYHLGVALHQLGRKAEARRELQGAIAAPGGFEGREDARALLGRP